MTEPVGTPESLPAEVTEPVDYGPEIVDLSRFEGRQRPVSYTHLDVYKRQRVTSLPPPLMLMSFC